MVRPRVLPSQRQRVAEACSFCRGVKKRCSGKIPCSTCLSRGIADSCRIVYRTRGPRKAASDEPAQAIDDGAVNDPDQVSQASIAATSPEANGDELQQPPHCEPRSAWQGGWAPPTPRASHGWAPDSISSHSWLSGDSPWPGSPARSSEEPNGQARGIWPPDRVVEQRTSVPEASHNIEPQPRMLLNLRGERVFIGGSATISFLQLVREVVSDNIGPTGFSHNETNESILEIQSPPTQTEFSVIELEVEQKQSYLRAFCGATEGLLDLFTTSELESLIFGGRGRDMTSISADKRATIELIVAIGAQCESSESARGPGKAYCRHAQQLIFAEMLSSPSVDLVRAFVLMAFYMLGDCRRNAAFIYLGIAVRAAVSLGLHSQFSYLDGSLRYQLRLRIWISLCILDMLVSSILGRPAATAGLRSDLDNRLAEISAAATNDQTRSVIASYRILSIVMDTIEKLYERKELTRSAVEKLLARIEFWRVSLPEGLLTSPAPASQGAAALHKGSIGKIHVSCLYYYAVTLVTRPVLISTLTAHLANRCPRHSHGAAACVDASVFMVQTCQEAYRAGIFLKNMCIIKAMVFSAGLILGFEIFAKRDMDYEIAAAFRGAGDVLGFLAAQSPQAAHYLDILTTLSRAILKQRETTSSRVRSGYVSKLLSIDSIKFRDRIGISSGFQGRTTHGSGLATLVEGSAAIRGDGNDGVQDNGVGVASSTTERQGESISAEGEVFWGLDSLDLSQWDKFPALEFGRL